MDSLLRCPFCGGEAFVHILGNEIAKGYYIACDECGVKTIVFGYEAEAIEAWNRRAESERKKGKWIVHDYALGRERYECAECKGRCDLEYNFCPHCGADMRGDCYYCLTKSEAVLMTMLPLLIVGLWLLIDWWAKR